MPLRFIPEPPNGTNFVWERVSALRNRAAATGHAALTGLMMKQASAAYAPYAVYNLPLRAIIDGSGLASARFWRFDYIVENELGQPEVVAHLGADEFGSPKFHGMELGGSAACPIVDALNELAVNSVVENGSYEVRFLRCKNIFLRAIWLKSDDEYVSDLLYPLVHFPRLLLDKAKPPFRSDDFMAVLLPTAQKSLQSNMRINTARQ